MISWNTFLVKQWSWKRLQLRRRLSLIVTWWPQTEFDLDLKAADWVWSWLDDPRPHTESDRNFSVCRPQTDYWNLAGLSVVILEAVMCIIVHASITLLTELQQMVLQIHLYINDEGPANDTTNCLVSSWKLFKLYLQILKWDWAYIPRQDPVKGLKVANLS